MAIGFDNISGAGTAYIDAAMASGFSYPFTVNFWFYPILASGINSMAALHNTSDNQSFRFNINGTTSRVVFAAFDTTVANASNSTITYTASAWNMYTAVGISATSRSVYLNGGNPGSNNISKTITTPTAWMLGGSWVAGAVAPSYEGRIAEFAIWDAELTATEIASLYTGIKATQIRPQNLKVYTHLIRDIADSRQTTTSITNSNTTVETHVRRYG